MKKKLPSKGEAAIASWLFLNEVEYVSEKEFEDLVNPHTNVNLRFDFFLPEKNIAIEFDGIHHYTHNSDHHADMQSFKAQKARDAIKDKYCKEKDIKLVRIPFYEKDKLYRILHENINCD